MSIPQTVYKTHATGNDFIMFADPDGVFEPTGDEVRRLCDRHFGIGADGLIRLTHPQSVGDLTERQLADCRAGGARWFMDYRNADGTLAEMCGNGTRATALFAMRGGFAVSDSPFLLGTRAGVKTLTPLGDVEPYGRDVFRVDMGAWSMGDVDAFTVTIPGVGGEAHGTFVDMGNPHVVAVLGVSAASQAGEGGGAMLGVGVAELPDVEALDLTAAPVVSPTLPSGQNVEFVRVDAIDASADTGRATMRVNERGCGETLSCGTGLCATAIVLRAKTGVSHWNITVRGGVLRVDVSDVDVRLTGPATIVARIDLETV